MVTIKMSHRATEAHLCRLDFQLPQLPLENKTPTRFSEALREGKL